ncbi:MAG TPA: hypothetical protein VK698_22540 [Kofleriaceae bacterium]|nr:hypothetical protein [Kofleriaceae bacterium]
MAEVKRYFVDYPKPRAWWGDWITAKIRPWWDEHVNDHAISRRRGCYILTYVFERY